MEGLFGISYPTASKETDASRGRTREYLRIYIDSTDGDRVNVRVPLAPVQTGIRPAAMLPAGANERFSERGIGLPQLNGLRWEDLVEALRELSIDVESSKGDRVRMFCG